MAAKESFHPPAGEASIPLDLGLKEAETKDQEHADKQPGDNREG